MHRILKDFALQTVHPKVAGIPFVVGPLGTVLKDYEKRQEKLGVRDHPDHCFVKIELRLD